MKKHILCFGDSNTHGYKSSDNSRFNEEERWTCLLNQYLGEDYLVIEEGLSGRTTTFEDPLFEGLSGLSSIYQCLMSHEPVDLLIIMLGTNDTKSRFNATAHNIAQGLERLTAKALSVQAAWSHGPSILLIAPPPIDKAYTKTEIVNTMGPGCAEKSQKLGALYKEVAERLHCHFLDAGTIPGIAMHPADYMHLDRESHLLLAKQLSKIIPDLV